jgi:hypothetical protein
MWNLLDNVRGEYYISAIQPNKKISTTSAKCRGEIQKVIADRAVIHVDCTLLRVGGRVKRGGGKKKQKGEGSFQEVVATIEDLKQKLREDADTKVPGNPKWSNAQHGVFQSTWKGACEEFGAFLVIMADLQQTEEGEVRCLPGIVTNGSMTAILEVMARFLVDTGLVVALKDYLVQIMEERGEEMAASVAAAAEGEKEKPIVEVVD